MQDNQYDNTNKGAMFTNLNRRGQSSPNIVGKINVNGIEYWISGWKKICQTGKRQGQSYYSCALRPVADQGQPSYGNGHQHPPTHQQQQQYQPQQQNQYSPNQQQNYMDDGFIEDDIPF